MTEGIGWIVDADVSTDFDSRDKTRLRDILRKRVKDGSIMRLIGKWLRVGVMEEGALTYPETGVFQGGVTTPRAEVPMLALPSFLPGKTRFLECRLYGPCWVRCLSETPWGPSRWRRWWAWPLQLRERDHARTSLSVGWARRGPGRVVHEYRGGDTLQPCDQSVLRTSAGGRQTQESGLDRLYAQAVDDHACHGPRYDPMATVGGVYRLTSKAPLDNQDSCSPLPRSGCWARLTAGVTLKIA
jgi:hypothetical protein